MLVAAKNPEMVKLIFQWYISLPFVCDPSELEKLFDTAITEGLSSIFEVMITSV